MLSTDRVGPPGSVLFHYTTREAAFEHILPNRTLRMRSYSLMRDPLEAKSWNLGAAFFAEKPDDEEFVVNVLSLANRVKKDTMLLSMTRDARGYDDQSIAMFGRGYARASMWEHYAEDHHGVCLAFDAEPFGRHVIAQMNELGVWDHGEVKYTRGGLIEDIEARTFIPQQTPGETEPSQAVSRHIVEHGESLFFTKLLDWQGEQEFRFTLFAPPKTELFLDFAETLQAVIVGEKFPYDQVDNARAAAEAAGAKLWRHMWLDGRPWLMPPDTGADEA